MFTKPQSCWLPAHKTGAAHTNTGKNPMRSVDEETRLGRIHAMRQTYAFDGRE
jgi:hypothetical protein